jgi:HAD superfamily hydrolase (TIGR01549 family)
MILFDLMNTLLCHEDSGPPYWHRLGDFVASKGTMPAATFNDLYARQREWRHSRGTRETTLVECLNNILLSGIHHDEIVSKLVDTFMEDYEAKTRTLEGVETMLEAWVGHTPLAVISNFFLPGFPERLLKRHGLRRYFEFVVDSAQVGHRKPAPEIYTAALTRAGIDPGDVANVFFVGDDWIADIEGSRQVGMIPIYYSARNAAEEGIPKIRNWNDFRPPAA